MPGVVGVTNEWWRINNYHHPCVWLRNIRWEAADAATNNGHASPWGDVYDKYKQEQSEDLEKFLTQELTA